MKISLTLVHKAVATLSIVALVAPMFAVPQVAQAATAPFTDSFEAPTNLGNWTVTSGWTANASQAHSGSKSAHVNQNSNTQRLETTISTVGYSNPAFSFWYRTESLDESQGDKVEVFYSTNGGGSWTEIPGSQIDHNDSQNQWHQFSYNSFPAGANNNANFKIRFQGDLDSGITSDKVWIDDVSLTGTPLKGTLVVKKVIVGNPDADEDDFSFSVNGGAAVAFEADGQNDLTNQNPGTYNIVETAAPNYTTTYSNCSNVTLSAGETETCTITNTYEEDEDFIKTIEIKKVVVGGQAGPEDFSVTVSKHFVGFPWLATNQEYPMDADGTITVQGAPLYIYNVVETDSGDYTPTYSGCDGIFFLIPGTKTCTITNTYDEPAPTTGSIEITKYVCPEGTTVVRSQNGVGGTVPQGCVPDQGAYFGYVHGVQTDANAPHPELGETPVVGGSTGVDGKLTISNLDATGRYLVVETDASGTKLPHEDVLGLYCEGDGDTSDNNDNQEITFVSAGGTAKCVAYNPGEPTPQVCEFVSNTTTLVGGNSAVETFVHGNWTTALNASGAKWLWNAAFANPAGPADEVVTFTKHFSITGTPTSVMLELAADNYYDVKINGMAACSDTVNEDNFSAVESCDITSLVTAGINTMEVTVTNEADHGTDPQANPAGVIYKVTVTGASCADSEPPAPNTLKVHILKYLKQGNDLVAATGELPSFPMSASWSASNIGAGSGSYVLGPAGHGGSGPYAADTSPMNAPADYSTQEIADGDTVIASDAACSPGKYRHVGYKTGNTLGEALASGTTIVPPTFSGLTADKYVIVVNEKCPDVSTVTLCKMSDAGNETYLSGWNLFLKGNLVDSFDVNSGNSAGMNSNVSLTAGTSYLATVVGTWTNQGGANPADAEYSTTDGWATQMNGYTGYGNGILELEINNTDGNWGPYNSGHQYAQSFTQGADGVANFRIFDGTGGVQNEGWFGDNNGTLPVSIFTGYAGITEEDGCVTFQNVPFGTYTLGEVPQDGWSYVSGAGEVIINAAEHVFTIVNHQNEPEVPVVDMCLNIDGTQSEIPLGYYQVDENCFQDTNGPVQTFSGSTGGDAGNVLGESTSTPEVLGDVCGLYMDKNLRLGSLKNDSEQTKKLQEFLNKWMSANLPVTGLFGPLTEAAVKAFQSKYADDILKPWGITTPTGLVYLTTIYKINQLECPELTQELPSLVEWSANPNVQ